MCVTLPRSPPRVSVCLVVCVTLLRSPLVCLPELCVCVLRCLVPASCVCLSWCVCVMLPHSPPHVSELCVCYVASFPPRVSVCLGMCVLCCLIPHLMCLSGCVCYVASFPCCVSVCTVVCVMLPRSPVVCLSVLLGVLRCLVPPPLVCLLCVTLPRSPVVCLSCCVCYVDSFLCCVSACVVCLSCVRIHNYVTQTVLALNPRDLINPLTSFTFPFFFLSPTLSLLPPSFSLSFMPLLPSSAEGRYMKTIS